MDIRIDVSPFSFFLIDCLFKLWFDKAADEYIRAEVKALKALVRNVIAPNRDLGHTDRALKKEQEKKEVDEAHNESKKECEDCV